MMLKFNRQVRFKIYCVVSLTLFFNKFIFFNFIFLWDYFSFKKNLSIGLTLDFAIVYFSYHIVK